MELDLIDILSKINKAALFFFLATIAFLAYEFYLFHKDRSKKKGIKLPQFGAASSPAAPPPISIKNQQPVAQIAPMTRKRNNKRALIVIGVTVFALGFAGLIAYRLVSTSSQEASVAPFNPQATDETVATDLSTSEDASASATVDNTASSSAKTDLTTEQVTGTQQESSDSALLAAGASATPVPQTTTSATATPTPTEVPAMTEDESDTDATDEAEKVIADAATPTPISQLPLTADNSTVPYTLFIFLGAIITFFVAFLY